MNSNAGTIDSGWTACKLILAKLSTRSGTTFSDRDIAQAVSQQVLPCIEFSTTVFGLQQACADSLFPPTQPHTPAYI
ncbi:MAG: hypothetical protein JSS77_09065 [Acidobacteria bacterium]|nr:hypothetical protein [Acidobacteriota bacterium]HMU33600.1 hypothetical protein [Pyrinomonadaceae bacterium]